MHGIHDWRQGFIPCKLALLCRMSRQQLCQAFSRQAIAVWAHMFCYGAKHPCNDTASR